MEASALPRATAIPRPRLAVPAPVLRLRSDDQLVALFRAGSDDAFRAIHDRYRVRLLAYASQMLGGSRADAEDALQDVFVRAHQALRSTRQPILLRAWLYRIAHNRCVDQLRRPAPIPSEIMPGAQLALSRGARHDPPAEAERSEDLRRLVADVHALPEQQRSALLMRELQGLSYEELGCALGISVAGVKSLLLRARGGVLDAAAARDTPCVEIRLELASAHDRGVRASGRARRHMRECDQCSSYRGELRSVSRRVAALVPVGPLGHLGLLFGIGGGGGAGAAGGGSLAAGSSSALLGGAASVTATKVAVIVCACALVGGAGALQASSPPSHHTHPRVARAHVTRHFVSYVASADPTTVARTAGGTIAPTPPSHLAGASSQPVSTGATGADELAVSSTSTTPGDPTSTIDSLSAATGAEPATTDPATTTTATGTVPGDTTTATGTQAAGQSTGTGALDGSGTNAAQSPPLTPGQAPTTTAGTPASPAEPGSTTSSTAGSSPSPTSSGSSGSTTTTSTPVTSAPVAPATGAGSSPQADFLRNAGAVGNADATSITGGTSAAGATAIHWDHRLRWSSDLHRAVAQLRYAAASHAAG
jgi:RNA polymerase sigma factor (sigma-70 family)